MGPGQQPRIRYHANGFEASDQWYVDFADLTRFMQVVGGTVESVGGVLNIVVPLRFKDYEFAIATSCEPEYVGYNSTTNTWKGAKVNVSYETPTYGVTGADAFLTESTNPSNRVLPLWTSAAAMASGAVGGDLHYEIGGFTYSVALHKRASLPLATWQSYGGYVNDATWRTYPAETVKFVGPSSQSTSSFNGIRTYEVTLLFEVSRINWNYEFNSAGTLAYAYYGGSNKRHPTASFSSIFGF